MKHVKSISVWAVLLLLGSFATSCVYRNYPPRHYDYGYGYRMPPRVIIVRPVPPPPPRVVYRDAPRYDRRSRYNNEQRGTRRQDQRLRSNRNYNQDRSYGQSERRDRSRGPR